MSQTPDDENTTHQGYDPEQDPDSDPEMLTSQHPDHGAGENRRDPAEGAPAEADQDG